MDKIVQHGCKIDFHIHSVNSKFKDKDRVNDLTLDNLNILINKLNENGVNICSFSDHDRFSFEYYKKLKEQEGIGSIQKVLPAVEFSVGFGDNPISGGIHTIAIFNDKDETKLKKLESILDPKSGSYIPYDGDDCYKEKTFLEILSKVDLDCLCIAHQKQTLTSKSKPLKRDANSLGEEKFAELVLVEYFESYEFKNRRNEIYNKQAIEKFNNGEKDLLRFVTGSDCHDWNFYPYSSENEKERDLFQFTYLKCLPNFKGVALALTDDSRISFNDNFFTPSSNYLDKIQLKLRGESIDIPLSKGINVIIGDNSIGKSLLVHAITNYYYLQDKKLEANYKAFMKDKKLSIVPSLSTNKIFKFDYQGYIRETFSDNLLNNDEVFRDYFPSDVQTDTIKSKLNDKLDSFCLTLETKFDYDRERSNLTNILVKDTNDIIMTNLVLYDVNVKPIEERSTKYDTITQYLELISTNINKLLANEDLPLEKEDFDSLTNLNKSVNDLKVKYKEREDDTLLKKSYADKINITFKSVRGKLDDYNNSQQQQKNVYLHEKENFAKTISTALKAYFKIKNFDFSIDISESLVNERSAHELYTFVKKLKVDKIDEKYVKELFLSPFGKNPQITFNDIYKIDRDEFRRALAGFSYSTYTDEFTYFKEKVNCKINEDLTNVSTIVRQGDSVDSGYSNGVNAKIYFDVSAVEDNKEGVYIIDQPEDDVSSLAIKNYLLNDFRCMRKQRQVILVTHNPQFVVNLDADNVIYLFYNDDNLFDIRSGALEYDDTERDHSNIMDIVANTLDGGVESIQRRWKCYEKNDSNL